MVRAVWQDTVLAEAESTVKVEGNHYFPPEAVRREHFVDSDRTTKCLWKGTAHYLTAQVNGEEAANVAWYYPDPSRAARKIKDHVAFYPKVQIEED
jgi:uncharacterized protein (DUF427 family)